MYSSVTLGPAFGGALAAARRADDRGLALLYRDLSPGVLAYFRAQGAIAVDDMTADVFVTMAGCSTRPQAVRR